MFARLTLMDIKPERIDEAIKIYEESVIPAARSQKNFLGAYLLSDRQAGKGVSITFWKSEADALANERNRYYQEQLVKFVPLLKDPPTPIREGYEVSVKV
jgi:heme-degrading monooxygenase HmoA